MTLPSLSSLTTTLRSLGYGPSLRPHRDWLVLLAVATSMVLVSVGWNLWLFSRASSGQVIGAGEPLPEPTPLDLTPTRRLIDERAAERSRYLESYRFVDPALGGPAPERAPLTPPPSAATLE